MKLRLDLAKALHPEDVMKMAEANSHRYKPEPVFSKTGTGYLSPTSTADSVKEEALSMGLIRKVTKRAGKSGKRSGKKS